MKKFLVLLAVAFLMLPTIVMADETTTTNTTSSAVGVAVGGGATQSLTQIGVPPNPGMGRLFAFPATVPNPGLANYFGPFISGWNVMDPEIMKYLPETLHMAQAQRMAVKGVKIEVRTLEELKYEFDTCKLYGSVPDKYRIIGYVFVSGTKSTTTVDADAAARIAAMKSGANAVILIKAKPTFQSDASGWGIGFSHVSATLWGGAEKDQASTSAGGFGYSSATAKPSSVDGLVYVMIQDEKGMGLLKKADIPPSPVKVIPTGKTNLSVPVKEFGPVLKSKITPEEQQAAFPFRCVATGSYIPPADCK